MKMKKCNKILGLLLFLVIGVLMTSNAFADNLNKLTIVQYRDYTESHNLLEEKKEGDTEVREGAVFKLWKLSPKEEAEDLYGLATELRGQGMSLLDGKFPFVVTKPTDAEGKTTVALEDGRYYAREIVVEDGEEKEVTGEVPFIVDLPMDGKRELTVYPKSTKPVTPEEAQIRLIKYSNEIKDDNRLQGVSFELFKESSNRKEEPSPVFVVMEKPGVYRYDETSTQTTLVTNEEGEILVKNLGNGDYFFVETDPLEGYLPLKENPTTSVPQKEPLEVINEKPETGGEKFRKVDGKGRYLQGATFKLAKKDLDANGNVVYETVQRNGGDYLQTADKDGKFEFSGLDFGTYFLVETKPPVRDGVSYQTLKKPMEFEVTKNSYDDDKVLNVVNKETPPGPKIPKTGDIQIFLYTISGLVIAGLGWYMYSLEERKKIH